MIKRTKIILPILVLITGLLIPVAACTQPTEPEYAAAITENVLLAMNAGDYAKFSQHFDDGMKQALPETVFQGQMLPTLRPIVGDYVPASKVFWKVETSGIFTDVYYRARFTLEDEVVIHLSFHESEGKTYINGFWFDSPKLRGQLS